MDTYLLDKLNKPNPRIAIIPTAAANHQPQKAAENGIETLPDYFDEEYAVNFREKYGSPRVICSNNLVADTDDLSGFVRGVKNLMDEDSIFFFETFYF